jgi:uncharacterized Zn finger protein
MNENVICNTCGCKDVALSSTESTVTARCKKCGAIATYEKQDGHVVEIVIRQGLVA